MAKDNNQSATIGFEDQLWRAADAPRSNMDAAEYKCVLLGLVYHRLQHRRTSCNHLT